MIGQILGKRYGQILDKTSTIKEMDAIVAIPLHPRKLQ